MATAPKAPGTTPRSSLPVVKESTIRDINNALAAVDGQLRQLFGLVDTANRKAGQNALDSGSTSGALILINQQLAQLQAAVAALAQVDTSPTITLRADIAVGALDSVFLSSSGGVSPVDTQDPTAIFAVFGIATAPAAAGGNVVVRRSGILDVPGAAFEAGRAVYAQIGGGLTQYPNYADVALPVGSAISSTQMAVRTAWPALNARPAYPGYEDFMPVTLVFVRHALEFIETIFGQPDGVVVKIGDRLVTRTLEAGSGIGIDNADGVAGDPVIFAKPVGGVFPGAGAVAVTGRQPAVVVTP